MGRRGIARVVGRSPRADAFVQRRAATEDGGMGVWSMLQVCLFDITSETFLRSRMSSSSGDERSGRKGTKIGAFAVPACDARWGFGEATGPWVGVVGGVANDAGEGNDVGYCEGAAGLGSRPEEFVNGWTARGSKDARTECDMAVAEEEWY